MPRSTRFLCALRALGGSQRLIRLDYHGSTEFPPNLPCHIEGSGAEVTECKMIDIPYSLVIEATEDPEFFAFYSPDLSGNRGIGHCLADCLNKPRHWMKEFMNTLKALNLPVPEQNPHPTIVIQNDRKLEEA